MGFSCSIRGKNEVDILKKYKIDSKFFGLASSNGEDDRAPYRLEELRSAFQAIPFKEEFPKAAQVCVKALQEMLKENLESLKHSHSECETCRCKSEAPKEWDMPQIKRFLSIPLEEVHSAEGGY